MHQERLDKSEREREREREGGGENNMCKQRDTCACVREEFLSEIL